MKTTHKRSTGHHDRTLRKALVFEGALHCWDSWLDSVAHGRKALGSQQSHPPLEEMMNVARKTLTEMKFPSCTLLEVYWFCCVFADYQTANGFKFDKLILPDWLSSLFRRDAYRTLDFKGKRIYPPQVWDEADVEFWFERDPSVRCLPTHIIDLNGIVPCRDSSTIKATILKKYLNNDFILVLTADNAVRKYIKRGRPITTRADGETPVE